MAYEWTTSIVINGGASSTTDEDVTLTISAVDSLGTTPTEMRVSEDDTFTGVAWEAYSTSKAFTLSNQTSFPTQTKTVYLQVRA